MKRILGAALLATALVACSSGDGITHRHFSNLMGAYDVDSIAVATSPTDTVALERFSSKAEVRYQLHVIYMGREQRLMEPRATLLIDGHRSDLNGDPPIRSEAGGSNVTETLFFDLDDSLIRSLTTASSARLEYWDISLDLDLGKIRRLIAPR